MDYLVSSENTPFFQWQLELLIESFKSNNCEKELLVCLNESNQLMHPFYCRNINSHERLINFQNIGKSKGFVGLNHLYNISWAIQNNRIQQPFAFIPTDVVLKNKVNDHFLASYPQIVFTPDPFFTFEIAEKEAGNFWEALDKNKLDYEEKWIPLGPVIFFNNLPIEWFDRSIAIAEKLVLQQILKKQPVWKHTTTLAMIINMIDFIGKISFYGDYELTMNMLQDYNCPFIHYEHGLPPVFNKHMFPFENPHYASLGDPFEILKENAPTRNCHFISELAKISIDKRNDCTTEKS